MSNHSINVIKINWIHRGTDLLFFLLNSLLTATTCYACDTCGFSDNTNPIHIIMYQSHSLSYTLIPNTRAMRIIYRFIHRKLTVATICSHQSLSIRHEIGEMESPLSTPLEFNIVAAVAVICHAVAR